MNKLTVNFKIFILAFIAIGVFSCVDDDDNGNVLDNNNSAFDFTVDNPEFTMFNRALILSGLDATLDQSGGTFTVFAPTDMAFQAFLSANGFATVNDVPILLLRNTLRNHMIGTVNLSTDFTDGYLKTIASNDTGDFIDLYVDTTSGIVLNGTTQIITVDRNVDNGVLHIVDEVIELPTTATFIEVDPNFSNFFTALNQEGLLMPLNSSSTEYTVFAPLNDAFQALIDEDPADSITSISDILALSNLSDILNYHIVSGMTVRNADIIDGDILDPLGPGTFTINTASGLVITDGNMSTVNITLTDLIAVNGVVHGIDLVLRP